MQELTPLTGHTHDLTSLHILGSRQLGGAESFFVRLVQSLNTAGHRARAVIRRASPVGIPLDDAVEAQLPLANGWDLYSLWRVRRLVHSLAPDILQTYMGRATRLTRLPRGTRTVHVARLGGYYKVDGYYRHAHAWVGNTRGICDHLLRAGLPAERVFFIGNFVDEPPPPDPVQQAGLRRRLALPQDAWVLLTLGRFIPKKGFADLLQAFARLPAQTGGRPLVLLLAGDGPQAAKLRELSRQLNLAERVHFLGWQADPKPYLDLADVLVCPSRHEPLGNVILEGWSHGLPVISTASDGGRELIRDEDNGLLVPPADPAALAARLQALLTAPQQEHRRLVDAGLAGLRREHSRNAVVGRYLALYSDLCRRRGG